MAATRLEHSASEPLASRNDSAPPSCTKRTLLPLLGVCTAGLVVLAFALLSSMKIKVLQLHRTVGDGKVNLFDAHPLAETFNESTHLSDEDVLLVLKRLGFESQMDGILLSPLTSTKEDDHAPAASGTSGCAAPWNPDLIPPAPYYPKPFFGWDTSDTKSAAWFLLKEGFTATQLLSAAAPESILGSLSKAMPDAMIAEVKAKQCMEKEPVPMAFCDAIVYQVPVGLKGKTVDRDSLARTAYGRVCEDKLGHTLLTRRQKPDVCAVVMAMMLCQSALPACEKQVYEATCLDTCILGSYCSKISTGVQSVHPSRCGEICRFPEQDLASVWEMLLGLVVLLCCCACCLTGIAASSERS